MLLTSKENVIKQQIYSGRKKYSLRNVIAQDDTVGKKRNTLDRTPYVLSHLTSTSSFYQSLRDATDVKW